MADIIGQALLDYHSGSYTEDIKTYSSLGEEDHMPLPYLFRSFDEMPLLEQKALELCNGKVLDIGCGAGNHVLYLQSKGYDVSGLDESKGAIAVCKKRGIKTTILSAILDFDDAKFDTILLLMNGIGLAGKLENIDRFLQHLKSLLRPNGQILLDSSDIIYMFDQDDDGGYWIPNNSNYYGEVSFQMEYKSRKSLPFPWLYLDFNTLKNACEAHNMTCEIVISGEHFDYLAKLSIKE
ncbi:bifunctional 2-polyprenyl-6-hydroxyphenol methylase/3-demethylubiquinol 3-O-methyltransferase UbiG [Flagellimonas sp. S3867]|uniref:class I SAM-dependent methyltransferase n=1 Tax=Flagellimonas sp. S3867 TaxID=2768063 RepID=UPI0016820A2D|nr:class I SAM-dependent methyltransferase [Flagellimonas sp. S3867]